MTGKYPAFEKFVTDFSNTLQSNEAGTVSRTSSVSCQ